MVKDWADTVFKIFAISETFPFSKLQKDFFQLFKVVDSFKVDLNFIKEAESVLSKLVEGMRIIRFGNEFDDIIDRTHECFFILKQVHDKLLRNSFFQMRELFLSFEKSTIIPIPLHNVRHANEGLMPDIQILNISSSYFLVFVDDDQHFEELKKISFCFNEE